MTIVNSFTPSTVISSSQTNANNTDIAAEITNSLPRDGQVGMTGVLLAQDGSVGAPGMSFVGDSNTGFRRSASGETKYVADGVDVLTINALGLAIGTTQIDALQTALTAQTFG
jgi:hypothetical protein